MNVVGPIGGSSPFEVELFVDRKVVQHEDKGSALLKIPVRVGDSYYQVTVGYHEGFTPDSQSQMEKVIWEIVKNLQGHEVIQCAAEHTVKTIGDAKQVSIEKIHQEDAVELLLEPELRYIDELRDNLLSEEQYLRASSLKSRFQGAVALTQLRKKLANEVFNGVVRPQIEALLKIHGENRPFDQIICIYGFNRLFTRTRASAGTDIDFMLTIDTKNQQLLKGIRNLIKEKIAPGLREIGVDMETADYLIIDIDSYKAKLNETRKSVRRQ